MLVTKQPVLRNFWYPVTPADQVQDIPKPFELLGQKIVLWRNSIGEPAATEDRCCHRAAQLSKGIVIEGNIRCPYHGWVFNSAGTCMQVPQTAAGMIPRTYQVQAYCCTERYGYVWVCLGEPLAPIPDLPEVDDLDFRLIPQFYEQWNCSGLRLMENSFDNAHLSFVHAATFGDDNPLPASIELIELEDGFQFKSIVPVVNPPLQQKNLGMVEERTVRVIDSRWFMPFTRKLHITYPNGLIHIIFTAATPINDCCSQIVQFCIRNDTEVDAKAADIVAFDRAVTLEDRAVLETTDYDTPLSLAKEQHLPSDKPGIMMRHRLSALLKAHGEVEQCKH